MKNSSRRTGRPTKAAEPGKRVSLGLKVTADIKHRLDEATKVSGRTQSQEAELRIEQSFALEEQWGGRDIRNLAQLAAATFEHAGATAAAANGHPDWSPAEWTRDPECYTAAVRAIVEALYGRVPTEDPYLRSQFLEGLVMKIEDLWGRERGEREGIIEGMVNRMPDLIARDG